MDRQLSTCVVVLLCVFRVQVCELFVKLPTKKELPYYYTIISNPIDMHSIQNRLTGKAFRHSATLLTDTVLTVLAVTVLAFLTLCSLLLSGYCSFYRHSVSLLTYTYHSAHSHNGDSYRRWTAPYSCVPGKKKPYPSLDAFKEDMSLMFDNAEKFNLEVCAYLFISALRVASQFVTVCAKPLRGRSVLRRSGVVVFAASRALLLVHLKGCDNRIWS